MAGFVKGDVVIIPFPFSDLTGSKRRPAMVLANLQGNDLILCQITSQNTKDSLAIVLSSADFAHGSLPVTSNIRPNRIFTADKSIVIKLVGTVNPVLYNQVKNVIIGLIS